MTEANWILEAEVVKATGMAAEFVAQWRAENLVMGEDFDRGEKRALVWRPQAVGRFEAWLGLQPGLTKKTAPAGAERAVWVIYGRRNSMTVHAVSEATWLLRTRITERAQIVRVRGTGRLPVGTACLCEREHDDLWRYVERVKR